MCCDTVWAFGSHRENKKGNEVEVNEDTFMFMF